MKITLDASIKEHREIAELFRNQNVFYPFINEIHEGNLIGINYNGSLIRFLVNSHMHFKITIDLSTAKMDLRMALGTGIKLKYLDEYGSDSWWAICDSDKMKFTLYSEINEGIDHKIKLCPDYLRLVGVEVED